MPVITRWFRVSHDINGDPEMWELRDTFGDRALAVWLECLSIADRNNGLVGQDTPQLHAVLASKCRVYSPKVRAILVWCLGKGWLELRDGLRIAKWSKYNKTRDIDEHPSETTPRLDITDKTIKNKHPTVPKLEPKPWPPEDLWLKNLIEQQPHFQHAVEPLSDFSWWEDIASALNGIEPAFIQPEFSKMSAWLRENPGRRPTTKGARRFVRSWLERARENQRRLYAVKK